MINPPPSAGPTSGSQQQAIIDAVARRQYGRWAAQYRAANVWAAVRRDTAVDRPAPPTTTSKPATTPQRLLALQDLRASGVISEAEFERFKAAVLAD